jgi:predicted outer membrane repeat protein
MRIITALLLLLSAFIIRVEAQPIFIDNQTGDWVTILTNAGVADPLNISEEVVIFNSNITADGLSVNVTGRASFANSIITFENNARLNYRLQSGGGFEEGNLSFNSGSILELFDEANLDNRGVLNFNGASRLKINNQAIFNNRAFGNVATINLISGGSSIELFNTATFNNIREAGAITTLDNARIKINNSGVFNNGGTIDAQGGTLIENRDDGLLNNLGSITLAGSSFIDTWGTSTTYTCMPAGTYGTEIRDQSGGTATLGNIPNGEICVMEIGVPTEIWDGNCNCVIPPVETFMVTNLLDDGPGSLRDAMRRSGERPGREIIEVDLASVGPAPVLVLSTWNDNPGHINRLPSVSDVEIRGHGLTIDANNEGRHFQISDNTTVRDISFINGSRTTSSFNSSGSLFVGGGRPCLIEDCFFYNNLATNWGGVVRVQSGDLTIRNSTFAMNEAEFGGAIYCWGDLTIENCTFNMNIATTNGGALYIRDGSNVTMNGSVLANSTPPGTGDLYLEDAQTLKDDRGVESSRAISTVFQNNLVEDCEGDCPTFELMEDPMLGELIYIPGQVPYFNVPANSPLYGSGIGANSAAAIPTLGEWGLIILSMLLLVIGVLSLRVKKTELS